MKINSKKIIIATIFSLFLFSCTTSKESKITNNKKITMSENINKVVKTREEWKKELTDNQFYIMIDKGTERPFTGEYWDVWDDGIYRCAACGAELFKSDTKFDAHCGWPSFYESLDSTKITTADDFKLGYKRTEIMCARCGAHLGHVFPDGPNPTGLRYCVNSASIKLDTTKNEK